MITLTGVLTTTGPLAISTGRADAASDRPVLRDGAGRPLLTGSSLAGALRAACQRRYDEATCEQLFGPAEISQQSPARRSGVRIDQASYLGDDIPPVQLRQHVAIDRERLAAAPGLKFDAESWPLGLRFGLRLQCEEGHLAPLVGTLEELSAPGSGIGAGPCPVVLSDLRATRAASTTERVRAAGRRFDQPNLPDPTGPELTLPEPAAPTSDGTRTFVIDLEVRTATPLACREPRDPFTSDRDNEPFTVLRYDEAGVPHRQPAIPGTSLLGVLRQRAERSVAELGLDPGDPTRPDGVDPRSPIGRTFGTAGSDQDDAHAGAVLVDDLVATDVDWDTESDPADQPHGLRRIRVKLDRLTHSTLASNLFDDTLVSEGTMLRGRLVVAPPDRPADERDLVLVAVGLRDLATGLVGVGGSNRSGYGTLELVTATLTERRTDRDVDEFERTDLTVSDSGVDWGERWTSRLVDAWASLTDTRVLIGGDHG